MEKNFYTSTQEKLSKATKAGGKRRLETMTAAERTARAKKAAAASAKVRSKKARRSRRRRKNDVHVSRPDSGRFRKLRIASGCRLVDVLRLIRSTEIWDVKLPDGSPGIRESEIALFLAGKQPPPPQEE